VQQERDIIARAALVAGEGDAVGFDAALDDLKIVRHVAKCPFMSGGRL
jgi:hypothetical protein